MDNKEIELDSATRDKRSLDCIRHPRKYVVIPELAFVYNVRTDLFDVLFNGELTTGKNAFTEKDHPDKSLEADKIALQVIAFMRSLSDRE